MYLRWKRLHHIIVKKASTTQWATKLFGRAARQEAAAKFFDLFREERELSMDRFYTHMQKMGQASNQVKKRQKKKDRPIR